MNHFVSVEILLELHVVERHSLRDKSDYIYLLSRKSTYKNVSVIKLFKVIKIFYNLY